MPGAGAILPDSPDPLGTANNGQLTTDNGQRTIDGLSLARGSRNGGTANPESLRASGVEGHRGHRGLGRGAPGLGAECAVDRCDDGPAESGRRPGGESGGSGSASDRGGRPGATGARG